VVVASVIGGAGRMGAWFATFLKKNGYRVTIFDKNKAAARALARKNGFGLVEDQDLAVRQAQLVILATPTQVTKSILEQILQHPELFLEKMFVEISSVKEPIRELHRRLSARAVPILSIHPMFGPGAKTLAGKTILTVATPRRSGLANSFLSLLRKRGANIVRCSFQDHDKIMSAVLALPHLLNIVMVKTLRKNPSSPERLLRFAGPSFRLQLLLAEAIFQENLNNEASIFMDCKNSLNAIEELARESAAILRTIKSRKRYRLLEGLRADYRYLRRDRFFSTAYQRFNEAVEASNLR